MPWRSIVTSGPVWAIVITHACSVFGYFTIVNQLPTYMKYILHFNIKEVHIINLIIMDKIRIRRYRFSSIYTYSRMEMIWKWWFVERPLILVTLSRQVHFRFINVHPGRLPASHEQTIRNCNTQNFHDIRWVKLRKRFRDFFSSSKYDNKISQIIK